MVFNDPLTSAYHFDFTDSINSANPAVVSGYPSLSGGSSKKNKVVKGATFQTRPSASYHYNKLKKPIGYKISYRPRKGGKYILHELALRKNGTPYWKALEKLPKKSRSSRKSRTSRKSRSSRKSRLSRR